MLVPYQRLDPDTLLALIESYIAREGTDYGDHEKDMQSKVEQVKKQIITGKVLIVYDEGSESINLITKENLANLEP